MAQPWEQDWSTPAKAAPANAAPWEVDWSSGPAATDEPPAEEERGLLRGAADLAIGVGRGAVQGVRMLSDVAGADNRVSSGLRSADEDRVNLMASLGATQVQIFRYLRLPGALPFMSNGMNASRKSCLVIAPAALLTVSLHAATGRPGRTRHQG
jgi:hypothetical protein